MENGVLLTDHKPKAHVESHLVTVEEFADFELRLQWKVSKSDGTDGGIYYRVVEGARYPYEVAPEMQVLGNNGSGIESWAAGGLWGLYPPQADARRPLDTWNDSLIVANGSHIEHWLNSVKLLECEIGSDDWEARVALSKFKDMPRFSKSAAGKICLHATPRDVQYRNIKLRTLMKGATGARPSSPQPAEPTTYLEGPVEPLSAAVLQTPLDANAWIRRSRWHLVRQNWKEARADCEQYLQLKPDNMWVRREHLDLCMALEEKNPKSYFVVAEYVRSLPAGRFALGDLRSLCLIPTPPKVAPSDLAAWAARSGHPKTISANVYLPAVHYRAGDWQACAAAAAKSFPNGPQGLFQVVPCLFAAAAHQQLGQDTAARQQLASIRDFVEQGKTVSYPGRRDEVILNLTFDSLHSQIFFREASELILGKREELKAPLALEIVNRQTRGK